MPLACDTQTCSQRPASRASISALSAQAICQVIDYGGTSGGSFIPALTALSHSVGRRGDNFVVFARRVAGATWPADLQAAGTDLRLVDSEADVVNGLRALRPQIVHTHFYRFDLPALYGAGDARVFWHEHSFRETDTPVARARAFMKYRLVGLRVESLVAVSEALRRDCIAWRAPRKRIRVVPNSIDTGRFRPPTTIERETARAALGIRPNDQVALFFERVPLKGGATLRDALGRLPHLRLLVAGGTPADRARFSDLPNVISLPRVADARQLHWAADVLAFASKGEGFGLVVAEALACGLPVAASDIAVVREITDGVPSVVHFPVGDAGALAGAIVAALERRNGCAGRERMVAGFGHERWTHDMLALYDRR
jgi:glycosyltransferase involved in cell wall biosynthesis